MALPNLSSIKSWSNETEHSITQHWKTEGNAFNAKTKKTIYSIDTPPPYVNTPIHMGHAVTYTYMDFFARYKRMKDFEVLFPLGLDRNGLPIEVAAEKKFNISPLHVSREKFVEACEKLLTEASSESVDSFARLGISFNSYKKSNTPGSIYHTDAPEYRALTQSTFISLFRKNSIYEATRINNWDTKLQTTIADSEIEYRDTQTTFNHIKFALKDSKQTITIATTRPELLCTCKMIIFEPGDERYTKLEAKTAIVPIYGQEVPIQEHPFAKKDKGSGLVMMCSAGDVTDIQFFREMNLVPTIAINKDGTMNEHAGLLKGLKVRDARQKIIEELKTHGLLQKQEQITHSTPVSERSGAEIEFIEMPEFYLKQLDQKNNLKEVANKIKFYPESSKELLESWIDQVSIDWPISRRRYYATPVPLWHSSDSKTQEKLTAVPTQNKYYQPWRDTVPKDAEVFKDGKYTGKKVKNFPKHKWQGDTRVLDTWFDSSISPLYLTQYNSNSNTSFFKKAFPMSLRPQGKEIIRTWLYYTLLRNYLETEKPAFKDIWIHQHILDEKGQKMSKSKGNVIDPMKIVDESGAEAFRMWCALEGDISKSDLVCSKDRIKAEQKTINKLLNVARFVLQFKKPSKVKLTTTDKLFTEYIEHLTAQAQEHYEKYDFHEPALKLRHFLWEVLASHYLELVKARTYNETKTFTKAESDSAKYTLYFLLERLLLLLFPIIPQVTSVIAQDLKLKLNKFPKIKEERNESLKLVNALMEFNSEIWKVKKSQNLSLREPLKNIDLSKALKPFEKDLKACHNLI